MSIGERLQSLYIACGNVKWFSHSGKQYGGYSKNIELPYDSVIPHLGT